MLSACAVTEDMQKTEELPGKAPRPEYHLAVYIPETAEFHSKPYADFLDAVLDVEEQAKRFYVHLTGDTHVFALVQKKFPDGSCQSIGDFSGPYVRALAESRVEADENFLKNKKHTKR